MKISKIIYYFFYFQNYIKLNIEKYNIKYYLKLIFYNNYL